jgi:murein DD-endopeptidase MepM/ murein hydrolase activator NlpD
MADTVKVKKGDTLSGIAAKAGVSLAAVKAANPQIANPSLIKPGQTVNLPAVTPAKAATPSSPSAVLAAAQAQIKKLEAAAAAEEKRIADAKTAATANVDAAKKEQADQYAANEKLAKELGRTYDPKTGKIGGPIATQKTDDNPPDDNDSVVSVYTDPETGDIFQVWKSGKRTLLKAGTKKQDEEAAANKERYDAEQAALAKAAAEQAEKRDAFALIQDTMRSYGFTDNEMSELSGYIQSAIIDPNLGPNAAILGMRNLKVYKQRFAGNEERVKAGRNALSEGEYLQQEKDYGQYFREYGVQDLATRERMATLIGNDISATEAKNRIGLAVDRVKNADPVIMQELKTYYPSLTEKDLVSYFLSPKEYLPELKRKVTASEIGAAAIGQGFKGATDALGLADYGVDRAEALAGYADIKSVLPTSEKLSDIYGEAGIDYTQATGEAEFLKQNQDAAEKRKRLRSMERASFMGSTGMTGNAGLAQSTQGRF